MNAPRTIPSMLTREPPLGRRRAGAAFDLDVPDAAAPLLVLLAPAPVAVAVDLATDDVFVAMAMLTELLMDEIVVQLDVAAAGWAAGVLGWPWKKVDVPYTPIGRSSSPRHEVKPAV